MKELHKFKYLVFCLYVIYAISPLVSDSGANAHGGLAANRESKGAMILFLKVILSGFFDSADNENSETEADFLVKKKRFFPPGNLFAKLFFIASRSSTHDYINNEAGLCSDQNSHFHSFIDEHTTRPFKGFSTLYSGLAPPFLFS